MEEVGCLLRKYTIRHAKRSSFQLPAAKALNVRVLNELDTIWLSVVSGSLGPCKNRIRAGVDWIRHNDVNLQGDPGIVAPLRPANQGESILLVNQERPKPELWAPCELSSYTYRTATSYM